MQLHAAVRTFRRIITPPQVFLAGWAFPVYIRNHQPRNRHSPQQPDVPAVGRQPDIPYKNDYYYCAQHDRPVYQPPPGKHLHDVFFFHLFNIVLHVHLEIHGFFQPPESGRSARSVSAPQIYHEQAEAVKQFSP